MNPSALPHPSLTAGKTAMETSRLAAVGEPMMVTLLRLASVLSLVFGAATLLLSTA